MHSSTMQTGSQEMRSPQEPWAAESAYSGVGQGEENGEAHGHSTTVMSPKSLTGCVLLQNAVVDEEAE